LIKKVLFLPGFHSKSFNPLEKGKEIKMRLEEAEWEVSVSNYSDGEPTRLPLPLYSEKVATEIELIKPVAIIAHSMAGLIVLRSILQSNHQVHKLILLESPVNGVPVWAMKIWIMKTDASLDWPSVRDMLRSSAFLQQLNKDWQRKQSQISLFQIGGVYSALLPRIFFFPQVPTKVFKTVTHSGLRSNRRVIETILQILKL
jgi:pimeloyl-ACP methyl ester carboxylesterase